MEDWENLPEHILVNILQMLTLHERYNASRVCKSWNETFQIPSLWQTFGFDFNIVEDGRRMKCLTRYGCHIKNLTILLNQGEEFNRANACRVLTSFARTTPRRLRSLKIEFTGENPLFYAGKEFTEALRMLFASGNVSDVAKLVTINLSNLPVSFEQPLIDTLSSNNHSLQYLNILNKNLICKVPPTSILQLVKHCRQLQELHLYSRSMSDEVLLAFTEEDRKPLRKLSMICRREEKYLKNLSSEAWKSFSDHLPNMRVTLGFDHTCPLFKIKEVMKPEILVSELRLETFSLIVEEINIASQSYSKTLQKVVIQTRPSAELNKALIDLALSCPALESLYVFCLLKKETIDAVLEIRPKIKQSDKYILKHVAEPWMDSWIAGVESAP